MTRLLHESFAWIFCMNLLSCDQRCCVVFALFKHGSCWFTPEEKWKSWFSHAYSLIHINLLSFRFSYLIHLWLTDTLSVFQREDWPEERKRFWWDFGSPEELPMRFYLYSFTFGGEKDPTKRIQVRYGMIPSRKATRNPKSLWKLFRDRNSLPEEFCSSGENSDIHWNTEGDVFTRIHQK